MMQSYGIILNEFFQVGFSEPSIFNEYEMNQALDKIYLKNIKNGEIFNRDIAQEIYEQTPKNSQQEVMLKDYVNTIIEAQRLLNIFIQETRDKIDHLQAQYEKQEQMDLLAQYEEDYYLLTAPFKISSKLRPKEGMDSRISKSNISAIFTQTSKLPNQSQSLQIILLICLSCIVVEFFMMFIKHHFVSMLTYVAVLSIFILNYFDKTYIRVTLYLLIISVSFDLLWIFLQVDNFWSVNGANQHCNGQQGFLRFIYIMTLILMIAKAVIVYFLLKYRSNTPQTCKTVKLFNFRFDLSAQFPSPVSIFVEKSL